MRYVTCEQIAEIFAAHIEKMSPREKALLRIEFRKQFNLPPQPEPDAYKN